jgi:DNA repair protein RadA/Sms
MRGFKSMAKAETLFTCQSCGHVERKWSGRCTSCGAWSSFVEERKTKASPSGRAASLRPQGAAVRITDVDAEKLPRVKLELGDLDRVLGGGLVPGSLVLLGGEPGVGKSTLLLALAKRVADKNGRVLYVSAEESTAQTRMRAERMNALHDDILLLAETDLGVVIDEVLRARPNVILLDSVQTMSSPDLDAAPGSVSQVREVTQRALQLAKVEGITTILVGHVTKDGALAGPKTLEHMVDTVLSFESTRAGPHRVLRASKNRFGSTHELAVFEMAAEGLKPVDNPSALFLAERPTGQPGSAVCATVEGTRPLLVEVQALCVSTPFGNPRRTTTGVDQVRVAMLAAVLERRCGLSLLGQDLFVNVAGGATLDEPAADLAVACAIASSLRNKPLDAHTACFGEIGLAGEVRGVARVEDRLEEIARLGFEKAIVPLSGTDALRVPKGLAVLRVRSLDEALQLAFAE